MTIIFKYLLPWEFSPTVLLVSLATFAVYLRGLYKGRVAGMHIEFWRPLVFLTGLLSMYAVLQTYLDYIAAHMFWVHRLQHVVLHHVGPFLIALSAPNEIFVRGIPHGMARLLRPLVTNKVAGGLYRVVQHPVVAPTLFVGLIYFWLTPTIHFYAMLSTPLYKAMNWSMAIDGLLFWWLIVGPERPGSAVRLSYGKRMIVLVAITMPQSVIGAYITFSHSALYDVYAVCGRAWPISPLLDQELGGLNTWLPPGMMSALGFIVVASRWMRAESGSGTNAVIAPAIAASGRIP